jgi:hypothetical protein
MPARVTLASERSTTIAGVPTLVFGRLTTLSGVPLPGAPIEVQQLTAAGERTIAQSTTGADGAWTITVQLSFNQNLRALHRPGPAAVSDLAPVGVAPAITLNLDSPSPLSVSGVITPPKRSVTIDAYLLQNGHRQLITTKTKEASVFRFGV